MFPRPFRLALRSHQSGRLDAAEHGYRRVLSADPRHADALHMLGVLAHHVGKHAVDLIGRAIARDGSIAAYHCNLGLAFVELGRLEAAEHSYREAIRLQPAAFGSGR